MNVTSADFLFNTRSTFDLWESTLFDEADRDAFDYYFDTDVWFPIFVFSAVSLCFITLAILCMIYNFKCKKKDHLGSRLKMYSLLSLMGFLIAPVFFTLYTINAKFAIGTLNKMTRSFWSIYNTCWSIGYLFTYLLLFERQRSSFQNTTFAMRPLHRIVYLVLLVAYFVSQQVLSGAWLLFVISEDWSWAEFVVPYYWCLGTKLVLDLILNVFIVFLFCSNIIKLTVRTRRTLSALNRCPESGITWHNGRSPKIFQTMIKLFVLSCFTIASTVLYTVSELTLSVSIDVAGYTGDYTFYRATYCVYFILCNVDALISTFFVVLSFTFARRWYTTLCGCLDGKCLKMWKNASAPKSPRGKSAESLSANNTTRDTPQETNHSPSSKSTGDAMLQVLPQPNIVECADLRDVSCNIGEEPQEKKVNGDGQHQGGQVNEQQEVTRTGTTDDSIVSQRSSLELFVIQETVCLDQLLGTLSKNISDCLGEEPESPMTKDEEEEFWKSRS